MNTNNKTFKLKNKSPNPVVFASFLPPDPNGLEQPLGALQPTTVPPGATITFTDLQVRAYDKSPVLLAGAASGIYEIEQLDGSAPAEAIVDLPPVPLRAKSDADAEAEELTENLSVFGSADVDDENDPNSAQPVPEGK